MSVVLNTGLMVFVIICDEIGFIVADTDDVVAECVTICLGNFEY